MSAQAGTATLREHIQELRRRLMWVLLFVIVGATAGYFIHDYLIDGMQRPLGDTLYYTAPTGAFSFIIKVCIVFGLIVALPMVIYQLFAFFGPLISKRTKRTTVFYVTSCLFLALGGITFAYMISLPASLNFLTTFGQSSNIESLITANEYFNFVMTFLLGFAVIFQLPLVISFINRIKPLKPSKMIGATRYIILGSFVVAAIITPTPDPLNQALMAGPVIALYLFSVIVISAKQRLGRKKQPVSLPPARVPLVNTSSVARPQPTPYRLPDPEPVPASQPAIRPVATGLISDFVGARAPLTPALQEVETIETQPDPYRSEPLPTDTAGPMSDFTDLYRPAPNG